MKTGIFKAHFDGSATPNPGDINIGGYIENGDKIIYQFSKNMGHGTNSEAEYLALIELSTKIISLNIKKVEIFGDSQLVVNQINGKFQIKKDNMRNLAKRVRRRLSHIPDWKLTWVRRCSNKKADALSKP